MMNSLRQRAWARFSGVFPERQIYIRSNGRVQFFSISTQVQALCTGLGLLFFGWVAFTSVNVIFKDRILAAKDRHFQQMQTAYETRIADLQLSYDELNGALIAAQDRFKTIADSLEAKQQTLTAVIEHKKTLETSLSRNAAPATEPSNLRPLSPTREGVGGVFDPLLPDAAAGLSPPTAMTGSLPAWHQPDQTQRSAPPVTTAPTRPSFFRGAVGRLGALFRHKFSTDNSEHPIIKEAAAQSVRIVRLELQEPALVSQIAQDVEKEASQLTRALNGTGIDSKSLMSRVNAGRDSLTPITFESSDPGAAGDGFAAGVADAMVAMQKLDNVVAALNAIPLALPTEFGSVSSGYGARVDPFNEQLAFHSGVDFSGPKGTPVIATGSGVVVFAGRRGEYGNTVEVDHGYGIRTRYAHLAQIVAQPGSRLDKGAVVGMLGSTGRSTGPHVHYEVWYDNAVRDPSKFIKAGQNVLKE